MILHIRLHWYTVPDRKDGSVCRTVKVGKEHGFGIAVPDLLGPDIYRIPVRVRVYVQEQLGRIHDFGDRVERMPSADDREESDRIENEQERAGDPEEIAHHQVGGPGSLQLRKAVEHIEGIAAFRFDMPVDFHRKRFEPVGKWYDDSFHFRTFEYQLGMAGKPEVDDLPSVPFCLFHKRVRETAKLAELRYPPDHVIAHPDKIQRPVQRGNAGIYLIKGSHGDPSCCLYGHFLEHLPGKQQRSPFRTPLPLNQSISCSSRIVYTGFPAPCRK